MCDYSLEHLTSRPAKVGDKLVTTRFKHSLTGGFCASASRTSPFASSRGRSLRSSARSKSRLVSGNARTKLEPR
jgi:hypothetical protein